MSVLINRLTRDHRRFGRVMSLLEALLERFQGGAEPDYALMCELLEYVVDYAGQVHHPSEELIFARLREVITATAPDVDLDIGPNANPDANPDANPNANPGVNTDLSHTTTDAMRPGESESLCAAIDGLTEQHQRLEAMNRAFRDALEGIVHEAVLSRDVVAAQGHAMIALLRQHIADEEARVFQFARALLSEDDWVRLEQQAPSADDPVFGQLDPLRFRTLYDHLKDDIDTDSGA